MSLLEVSLATAAVERVDDGWSLRIAITFHNKGGAVFELDKVTACADGRLSNHVFDVRDNLEEIPYRGKMKKRAHPGRSGFVRLKPGKQVTYEVQLENAYALPPGGGVISVRFDHYNHFSKDRVQLTSAPLSVTLE